MRTEVLSQVIACLLGFRRIRKGQKIAEILFIDPEKRRNVWRKPPVFLAGNNEWLDISFTIRASQLMDYRRSHLDQMKFVSNIRSFRLIMNDAICIDTLNTFISRLI